MKINRTICAVFLLTLFSFACESPSLKKANTAATPMTVEDKQARFESDVQTMRTANLKDIFVFRRKDGAAFEKEDKAYLRTNLPAAVNRTILTDEDKAVVVGSNYGFPPENLDILRMRFNVEDFSAAQNEAK